MTTRNVLFGQMTHRILFVDEVKGLVLKRDLAHIAFAQVQIVLMIALGPLLSAFQGVIPLHSPVVNAVVVPLVTLLVLPLLLTAALLYLPAPALADPLLTVAEVSLDLVMYSVTAAAGLPMTQVSVGGAGSWLLMLLVLVLTVGLIFRTVGLW